MKPILNVNQLAFSYPETQEPVFHNINFSIQKGDILSILGRNGVGKSTLIKCLLRILPFSNGQIELHGKSIQLLQHKEIARILSYVPQTQHTPFCFAVPDFVLMGRSAHLSVFQTPSKRDYELAMQALQTVGVEHLAGKTIGELSGGELQMIMIARAIAQQAEVLILDEPTSHLDLKNQMMVLSVIEKLANQGLAVIMTSHYPDQAFMLPQKVAVMKNQTFIAFGEAADVLTTEKLTETYGIDIEVCYLQQLQRNVCIPSFRSSRRLSFQTVDIPKRKCVSC